MFLNFRTFRNRIKKRKNHDTHELTLENSNLTPAQVATAQKALRILDLESRLDELTKQEFVIFLYAMGLNPTDDIIDSKLRSFKLHHRKTYTFGQLAHVWYSMLQDLTDEDEILKRAFQFFDKDGNGEISVQELRTTMHELGDLLTDEEITAFMKIMDVNNDGAIGYNEFLATLKTQAPNTVDRDANGGAGPHDQGPPPPPQAEGSMAGPTRLGQHSAGEGLAVSAPVPGQPSPSDSSPGGGHAGRPGGDPTPTRGTLDQPARPGSRVSLASPSSPQLPTFPVRRQTSLRAGLQAPQPSAPAEQLQGASPGLPRPNSHRLAHSSSMSRATSAPLGSEVNGLVRSPSQSRAEDAAPLPASPRAGSRSGAAAGTDPGQGLRAPSALEPGSGSEGT